MPAVAPRRARSERGPASVSSWWLSVELSLGAALLGATALAGAFLVKRPGPNRADVAGDFYLPAATGSYLANELVKLGSRPVVIVAVAVIFLIGIATDWVRGISCSAAPVIALLIVEHIAKPLVGREIGSGGFSFPSGTVTAVAAVATALFLVAPRLLKPLVLILGAVAVLGVGAAVIVLRWHYPTDVLGGICVGAGAVLFLDGLLHVPFRLRRSLVERSRARSKIDLAGPSSVYRSSPIES